MKSFIAFFANLELFNLPVIRYNDLRLFQYGEGFDFPRMVRFKVIKIFGKERFKYGSS
jgi:hypothetical protein